MVRGLLPCLIYLFFIRYAAGGTTKVDKLVTSTFATTNVAYNMWIQPCCRKPPSYTYASGLVRASF